MTFMPTHKATGAMAPGQIRNEFTIADIVANEERRGKAEMSSPPTIFVQPFGSNGGFSATPSATMPPWDVWWHSRPKGLIPAHVIQQFKDEAGLGCD